MKRFTLILSAILVIALVATVACARAPAPVPSPPMPVPAPAPAPAPRPASAPAPTISIPSAQGGTLPSTTEERKIVRTGNMSLVVKDVLSARDKIAQISDGLGGYVVSSSISGAEENIRGTISVRVPDTKFEPALAQFRALAVRVKSESTTSQDVTEEYIDLKARLKNAEATESQYLALLNKATTVEETLKIYDSLSRVRSQIEQLKGRIQYLERTTSMSFISVNLEPETSAKPLAPVGWSAPEVFKSAIRGIATFGQWLGTLVIWLLIFLPVWGIIGGIIYWRLHSRRKAKTS